MSLKKTLIASTAILAAGLSLSTSVSAQALETYRVKITNITHGITFTPFLAASHKSDLKVFEVGQAASDEVARVAEGGDVGPLATQLDASSSVADTATTSGLLGPGESTEFELQSRPFVSFVSIVSMLLPTNDTMVALNQAVLPGFRTAKLTYYMNAYDAGTETNSELCADIPGPRCGGSPFSPDDSGEGYVFPSPGIHGEADLTRARYNWGGAVAKVEIERIR
ncbi:spondin domain-containing protein [Pseudoteredinibacter isoporae]|uniref:spondin domain-containing protein n=1 Tax=Pseudoteredinibacter isoporae TaxID=570281 RepID=UPI0031095C70